MDQVWKCAGLKAVRGALSRDSPLLREGLGDAFRMCERAFLSGGNGGGG